MQELSARAALVTAPEVTDGLSTSVSREEVAAALGAADGPPDLILDVTRFSNGDPAETRNLVVAWERGDLEELLRQTESDQIVLTFDREAIRQAMEADVEAHGIREKALVLAVAAVAATGAAAQASAQPGPDDRAVSMATSVGQAEIPYLSHGILTPEAAAAATGAVSPDDRAVSKETSVGQAEIPYLSHGILTPEAAAAASGSVNPDDRAVSMAAPDTGSASEAIASEIPYLSHGILTPEAAAAASGSVNPDDRAVSMAAPETASASEAIAADAAVSPDDRAVSMAAPATGSASEAISAEIPYLSHGVLTPEAAAAASGSVSPDDRAVSMAAPAPAEVAAATDSGISISAPDAATTVGIGAALALAITGAGFMVAGRRRMTPAS